MYLLVIFDRHINSPSTSPPNLIPPSSLAMAVQKLDLRSIMNKISTFTDSPWCKNKDIRNNDITNVYSALHKSGSIWLHQNLLSLCFLAQKDYYSPNGCDEESGYCDPMSAARSNIPSKLIMTEETNVSMADIPHGSCVGPVRSFESNAGGILHKDPLFPIVHVFMLRNPLDMLVSAYYSFGWTHVPSPGFDGVPEPGNRDMEIDTYVIRALPELRKRFDEIYKTLQNSCCTITSDPKCSYFCVIITYEESMTSYATWLEKITKTLSCNREAQDLSASMVFQKKSMAVQRIMTQPIEANKGHVRSGIPGNYAQHLSVNTIELVRNELVDTFELLRLSLGGLEVEGFYALPEMTTWV